MRWICLLPLVGLLAAPVRGQTITPPAVGQPADFSQIVGAFTIAAAAKPTKVAVEEPIDLEITITGQAVAPHLPRRAQLKVFPPDLERQFFVEPISEHALPGEWRFTYRLRPKTTEVRHIPGLTLVYFAPRSKRYQTAYSDAIAIQVTPRVERPIEVPGLQIVSAPASFFVWAPLPSAGATEIWATSPGALIVALLLPALTALGGAWLWQSTHPPAHETMRRRRTVAAHTTLTGLETAQTAPEAALWLADYLRTRWDFPAAEPTPRDVDRWLKRRGVRTAVRARWRQFFQTCDAVRYVPGAASESGWSRVEAAELIRALEAEPCALSAL